MKIGIIGAGAMGGAIADGLLNKGVIPAADLIVSNRSAEKLQRFAERGAKTTLINRDVVSQADVVILAVKPWLVEAVVGEIRDILDDGKVLVSVAAGISGDQLVEWTEGNVPVYVAIPNIAMARGESMTFLAPINVPANGADSLEAVFSAMGKTCICDEAHLQAGMALASCGIAYAFRYIRAASEGGVELGFKARQAQDIVMQTLKGAVALLEAEGLHPEEAVDRVTTPGGITIRGLNAMEQAGFTNAVVQGLKASVK